MKYLKCFLLSIVCLFHVVVTYGQKENKVTDRKQHALEISYGTPSLVAYFETPSEGGSSWMTQYYPKGQKVADIYHHPNINLSYVYSWSKRWDLVALANVHLNSFKVMQYPEKQDNVSSEVQGYKEYDWTQEPTFLRQERQIRGSLSIAVRYHWFVGEQVSCYSALGISLWTIPLPYISPIGVRFGKGRIYGLVEANISAANMVGMAGLGIRL